MTAVLFGCNFLISLNFGLAVKKTKTLGVKKRGKSKKLEDPEAVKRARAEVIIPEGNLYLYFNVCCALQLIICYYVHYREKRKKMPC